MKFVPGLLIWTDDLRIAVASIYSAITYDKSDHPVLTGATDARADRGPCMVISVIEDTRNGDMPWMFLMNPEFIGWTWSWTDVNWGYDELQPR
jgi:hypothetical protein